jgi:hypothetical protein
MRPGSCRPLQISDLMILVLATAGGLFLVKQVSPNYAGGGPIVLWVEDWMRTWITPWLSMMSMAIFVIRLRRPRPRLRRILRQPGAVAAVMALASLGYIGLLTLGRVAVRGDLRNPLGDYFDLSLIQAGPMIAGAWIALRLTGRLHRERGWIDGLGTLVGALWVLIAMLFEFCLLAYG